MTRLVQEPLFALAVDVRHLRDEERTILEAIDKLGSITLRDAGRIVYRLRNRRRPLDAAEAFRSAGWRTIRHLHELGLVARDGDRWARRTERSTT